MLATGKHVPEVAKEYGYSKHTFYRVIKGERPIQVVQELIAVIINRPISEIWSSDQIQEMRT